jgi:O-methyltransferase
MEQSRRKASKGRYGVTDRAKNKLEQPGPVQRIDANEIGPDSVFKSVRYLRRISTNKTWLQDPVFRDEFERVVPLKDRQSGERKFFLRSILALVDDVPGDTAEVGVWRGASSWFICNHFRHSEKMHHGFDSFNGLSTPIEVDGPRWKGREFRVSQDVAARALVRFDARLYEGWIPDRFCEVQDLTFCFVHIDVDLFEPTRDAIDFFYPRMASGGIMLIDDYGFVSCPGAAQAADDYFANRPEPLVHVPTGQAFIIKR